MKKCPTCEKTFEDSMRFCQVDGTPLVDDAPAFDPYATIVARPIPVEPVVGAVTQPSEPIGDGSAAPEIHQTVGSIPIAEPEDVLDLPSSDPLKTMYVSDSEMQAALSNADIMEIPPIEAVSQPTPPSFIAPDPAPVFVPEPEPAPFEPAPPPSPFAAESLPAEPVAPVFLDPEPVAPVYEQPAPAFEPAPPPAFQEADRQDFDEAATMIQPSFQSPFDQTPAAFDQAPAPVDQWTPPPAPEASWQNQQIGANTPFQPPPVGTAGQNKTLAIVSLVLGILSFLCCSSLFVVGLAAIITGFMARGKASSNPNEFAGGGLALAGMILGGLSLLIGLVYWIMVISGAISIPNF